MLFAIVPRFVFHNVSSADLAFVASAFDMRLNPLGLCFFLPFPVRFGCLVPNVFDPVVAQTITCGKANTQRDTKEKEKKQSKQEEGGRRWTSADAVTVQLAVRGAGGLAAAFDLALVIRLAASGRYRSRRRQSETEAKQTHRETQKRKGQYW